MRAVELEHTADPYEGESFGLLMKRVLVSMTHRADGLLEPYGLTSAQGAPLIYLTGGNSLTLSEIARSLQADAGATTRLIDRLERKRLCRRIRSTADRREIRVELTPEGEASVSKVPGVFCTVMNEHLAGFSSREWDALTRYLQDMVRNAERMPAGTRWRAGAPPLASEQSDRGTAAASLATRVPEMGVITQAVTPNSSG